MKTIEKVVFNASNWTGDVYEIVYGKGKIKLLGENFKYEMNEEGNILAVKSEYGEHYQVIKIDNTWIASVSYSLLKRENENPFVAFGQLYSNL